MKVKTKEKTKKSVVIKLSSREADMLLSILVDTQSADDEYDFLTADTYPFLSRLRMALRDT